MIPNPKTSSVFWVINRKDSNCSQCQKELGKGNFLTIENEKGLCMACADLDHLVFLDARQSVRGRIDEVLERWEICSG